MKNFVIYLKDHLLARILGRAFNGEEHSFSDEEHMHIRIINDQIYRHQILHLNCIIYNMRWDQNTINPRTHADFMVLNPGEDNPAEYKCHPYWYSRVCGIFHTYVQYVGPSSLSKDKRHVKWVWWFGRDLHMPDGFAMWRLHRLGFVNVDELRAFGFLNPSPVIHVVHLIPAFHHKRTQELMGPSLLQREHGAMIKKTENSTMWICKWHFDV